MRENTTVRLTTLSPGAGCACKLPQASLETLMTSLNGFGASAADDLLVGLPEGDDAAVLRLGDGQALILTTDFFTPVLDDPYDWGRVAAANAMSDVYAMGGRPVAALNLAAWPGDGLPLEMLADVMRGASTKAAEGGCAVVGGHTIADPVPKYGMAVIGLADPAHLMTIDKVRPGDLLVLTKPLGTGVIVTALKQDAADPATLAEAVTSMTTLNAHAARAATDAGVRAATDVTGFGLLGHLRRMLSASGLAAKVDADHVPLLPDARELAAKGFVPGGTKANMSFLTDWVDVAVSVDEEVAILLHDAQTSGGLLLAVPPTAADLVEKLREHDVSTAVIGEAVVGRPGHISVHAGA
ncbi:selenide, water dikinase SelD [Herbidospora sp. NBRC 101105]|uniref:selenide, water dikinase SelD n=1 Tax=Herbidospora sp. NBRC 101105 TaxID=3032195 RepID=UPI0024A5D492|nr:selenide, water dikinase SelD [Herbidospora sp. NBRC 101105]GLX99569.1 selenide, water dikinase [Herbidospora sp. NBRC 101105]